MAASRRTPDLVSAYALGVGVGLIALQVTWLIANRLATLMWGVPVGPVVGFSTAMLVGIGVSIVMGRRFASKVGPDPETVDPLQVIEPTTTAI